MGADEETAVCDRLGRPASRHGESDDLLAISLSKPPLVSKRL